MIEIQESFGERLQQTIKIFINNIFKITTPIVVFNILFLAIFPVIATQIIPISEMLSGDVNSKIGILMSFGMAFGGLYFLIYIISLIPLQLAIIKSVKDVIYGEDIDILLNIRYGFNALGGIFKTYWYIFTYIYLIPAIVFIIGGVIFVGTSFTYGGFAQIGATIGFILMLISVIIFSVFSIYRGLKSRFGIISAIDSQEFTQSNLDQSIALSNGKWWRIFGNIFAVGFIIGIILKIFRSIGTLFIAFSYNWEEIITAVQNNNIDIQKVATELTQFHISGFVNKIVQTGLSSALGVIIVIFTYLLFKRLQYEALKNKSS